MKKKLLVVLMASALTASLLAGCGSSSTTKESSDSESSAVENESSSNESNGEKVEITFWDNYADTIHTEIYNQLISDFEAENPDITVKYVPLPSDQAKSKYDVAIQSKSTPDCGVIYQYWMNDFVVQDALVPLDDYVANWDAKDELLDTFQNSIKESAPDGKIYSLAQYAVVPTVWYNSSLFENAGVEVPTNWDQVFDAAKQVTDKANGVYGFSIRGGAGSSQQLEQMLYQYSGITDMFDENGNSTINDPAHVEFLEKFAALYNEYTPESDITNASSEMISAFDSGSAAMIFHNVGSYGQHRDTLGEDNFGALVDLKSKDDSSVIVSNGVISLSVFKNSEHPEEAFRFISYLAEHKADSLLNEKLGSVPCNKVALEDEWVKESAPVQKAAEALLSADTKVATLPINVTGYFDLHQNTLATHFQNVLLGNESAQAYLDTWADSMTQLKKQYDEHVVTK